MTNLDTLTSISRGYLTRLGPIVDDDLPLLLAVLPLK